MENVYPEVGHVGGRGDKGREGIAAGLQGEGTSWGRRGNVLREVALGVEVEHLEGRALAVEVERLEGGRWALR